MRGSGVVPAAGVAGKRSRTLDVLRGVAVLLVLGRHVPIEETGPLVDFAHRVGWIGVDLFFVLSGFLVSGLLFGEYQTKGELRMKRFFIRRGLKIYPAFYVLLTYAVVTRLYFGRELPVSAVLSEGLFVANYGPSLWTHTWSLGVEEHFYILLGVTIWWLARRGGADPFRPLVPTLVIVAVAALTARVATTLLLPYNHKTHLFPTHLRIDSLGFGVLLGYLFHFHRERLVAFVTAHRRSILVGSLVLILPATLLRLESGGVVVTFGLTGLYLGFGGLLVCAINHSGGPLRRFGIVGGALAGIGVYSYSIYLWHMATVGFATRLGQKVFGASGGPDWVRVVFYVLGSIAVGTVMARLIELPVLRLRDQWFPSRRPLQPMTIQSVTRERSADAVPESAGLAGPGKSRN
jgi:peptidoglycan/LPS O-acetylase OafA/YrhL